MALDWRKLPFEKLLVEPVRNGIYKKKEFHGRGAKIVNMGELFAHPRLRAVTMKRVDLNDSEASRFLLADGDLIFARRSLTAEGAGKCSIVLEVTEATTFESSIIRARPDKDKADSLYLYYFFNSPIGSHSLDTIRRQVAVAGITGSDLAKLEIPVPSLQEQRAVAHILGTLDDKIELNRRTNETLEAMARALFKAWFVDFEPVRAKLEGRWQRGQSLPGLPAHLYDLFPDRLVESELGEIPEGWEIARVSDFLSLSYGKSLPAGSRNPGGIPVYGSGGITGYHDTALVDVEAVIVGRKGTVGSLYWEQHPCFPIDTVFYVQPLGPLPFCFHLLESLPLSGMNTDAAVPGLNRENVYRLEVVSPPQALLDSFSVLARGLRDQIFSLQSESRSLGQLRDTLLPRLISGELRVPDAEAFLKERGL